MTEQDTLNIKNARALYSGEDSELSILSDDIVWHVPGHNPVSGDYVGKKAYKEEMVSKMQPLDFWSFELRSVMVNGSYVVVTLQVHGQRKGNFITLMGAHILRMNDEAHIVEGWGFTDDQDALDDFFSA